VGGNFILKSFNFFKKDLEVKIKLVYLQPLNEKDGIDGLES